MGTRGQQLHAAQPPGDEAGGERVPGGTGLAGRDLRPEYFPAPFGVAPGGNHGEHVHDPSTFTDLDGQRVDGHQGKGYDLAQRPVTELLYLLTKVRGHARDLRF